GPRGRLLAPPLGLDVFGHPGDGVHPSPVEHGSRHRFCDAGGVVDVLEQTRARLDVRRQRPVHPLQPRTRLPGPHHLDHPGPLQGVEVVVEPGHGNAEAIGHLTHGRRLHELAEDAEAGRVVELLEDPQVVDEERFTVTQLHGRRPTYRITAPYSSDLNNLRFVEHGYLPAQRGDRFSRNAATPSFASSVRATAVSPPWRRSRAVSKSRSAMA